MATRRGVLAALFLAGLAALAGPVRRPVDAADARPRVTRAPFGRLPDGQAIEVFTLQNAHGVEVRAINYGGTIVSLRVPDRQGRPGDVVLGYDDLDGYVRDRSYLGSIIGRYGNRIAGAKFTLDGKTYALAANDGPNHLHGGKRGFDKVVWKGEPLEKDGHAGVVFSYTSPDGDEGYPGKLDVKVTYTLNDRNELAFDYAATTSAPTHVNLTQHSYFNLAGDGTRDVLGHELVIDAEKYTPVGAGLIPTGELASVTATPLDFRQRTALGARIDASHEQIKLGRGYDHNFVLDRKGGGLSRAALVVEPTTGRTLEVLTTEPGVQFYSGNFLDGSITGKSGKKYQRRYGFCLETQHYPDTPNQPKFPSTVLRPGQEYHTQTVLRFGVQK